MKSIITIPDLLLFSSIIILSITIIVMLFRIIVKNRFLVILLSLYFTVTSILIVLILLLKFELITTISTFFMTFASFILASNNILHFLSLKALINKQTKFNFWDLIHLIPLLFIIILVSLFISPIRFFPSQLVMNQLEILKGLYLCKIEDYFIFIRIAHPLIYVILSVSLVFNFYKSFSPIDKSVEIKNFVLLLLVNKIAILVWFCIGFAAIKTDDYFLTTISEIGFSISVLTNASFILLNPKLLLKISKINHFINKAVNEDRKMIDIYSNLNQIIISNQSFLEANYALNNLSVDSGISAIVIRDLIIQNGFENYSGYINSFRVTHAIKLIQNGHLEKFSIDSLSKNSGFQSEVTFYRVFKKINKCTPKQYRKNLTLLNSDSMVSL